MGYENFEENEETKELPKSVELLERPGEMPETAEPQHQTKDLFKGLMLESYTKEEPEKPEQSAFRYTEASWREINGSFRYEPARITGMYADSLDKPEWKSLSEELSDWRFQEGERSCTVACEAMVVSDLKGIDQSMEAWKSFSESRDWYQPEIGTYTGDIGKISEAYGLQREQSRTMTMEDLITAKHQGSELIVCVDELMLKYPNLERICKPNHTLEVIGFDLTDKENQKVIVNDPGRLEGCGQAYPMELFARAACDIDPVTGAQTLHHVTMITQKEET